MIAALDDGIVVVMTDCPEGPPQPDSYEQAMQKVRAMVARLPPPLDPPEDSPPESRRVYWQMKEIAARMAMQIAASRRDRAEREQRRQRTSGDAAPASPGLVYAAPTSRALVARERGADEWNQLHRIERRLGELERTIAIIHEQMSTKVELESLKDDIRIAVDGYASVDVHLQAISARLQTLDARVERLELRVVALDSRVGRLEERVDRLEGT